MKHKHNVNIADIADPAMAGPTSLKTP